jgi:hypothetical protein
MTVSLKGVTPETAQPNAIVLPKKVDELPRDLIARMFSYLGKKDLQAGAFVNKRINVGAIVAANHKELASIKKFIESLIEKLDEERFPEQLEMLKGISQNISTQVQVFANLRLLKEYILDVKGQLVDVMKTVDDLSGDVDLPDFFEDIFKLVALEKRIDAANLIPNEDMRGGALWWISLDLAKNDNIKSAMAIAALIPNESRRFSLLRIYHAPLPHMAFRSAFPELF